MSDKNRSSAFERVLRYASAKSPKYISYSLALLGMVALYPNIHLPPELAALAGGVGVEAIGNLLDRMSSQDEEDETRIEEIVETVTNIIKETNVDHVLQKGEFVSAYRKLNQRLKKISQQNSVLYTLLNQLKDESEAGTSDGESLRNDVALLLSSRGYNVEQNVTLGTSFFELVARRDDPLEKLLFVVDCIPSHSPITENEVKISLAKVLNVVSTQYLVKLLIIVTTDYTKDAHLFAASNPNIVLMTLEGLENQLIDFGRYGESYIYNYEKSLGIFNEGHLHQHYVELSVNSDNGIKRSISGAFFEWLGDSSNYLLFLLGDYGSGKTSFSRRTVYKLLYDRYREEKYQRFIPILINLRDYRNIFDIKHIVQDTLRNNYGVEVHSFATFERMCSSGKILLFLDGLDEMVETSDRATTMKIFGQIYLLTSLQTKVVVTCRSNYFRNHRDIIEALRNLKLEIPVEMNSDNYLATLEFEGQGKILYIHTLDNDQIFEFISKRFGVDAENIVKQIEAIHDLSDLSKRPVLLDMILSTLPRLANEATEINSASLYEHYTNKWVVRDDWRVSSALNIRQYFCELLAWELHISTLSENYEISYPLLEQAMEYVSTSITSDLSQSEKLHNDIQTCSFLVRVGKGELFRFAHKSFAEYFVARKIAKSFVTGDELDLRGLEDLVEKNESTSANDNNESVSLSTILSKGQAFRINDPFLLYERSMFQETQQHFYSLIRSIEMDTISMDIKRFRWGGGGRDSLEFHISDRLSRFFKSDNIVKEANLSEEIATFAIEYFDISNINLQEITSKQLSDGSIHILSELFRRNKSESYIKKNKEYILDYLKQGGSEQLKAALAASLANCTNLIDVTLTKLLYELLEPDSWSYFLFTAAGNSSISMDLFDNLPDIAELRLIDRTICAYGIQTRAPSDSSIGITKTLVFDLLTSEENNEQQLGISLIDLLSLTFNEIVELAFNVQKSTDSVDITKRILGHLGIYDDERSLKKMRVLSTKFEDKSIRQDILRMEQQIRSYSAESKGRKKWKHKKGDQLSEKIWNILAHK